MRRTDRSALSMPAAVQRSTICPSRHLVTLRLVVRAIEIIDSIGLEVVSVLASRPSMPSRLTVNISSRPSRSEAAAPGWVLFSSPASCLALRSPCSVGVPERLDQFGVDPLRVLLGQVVGHVPALVQGTALDQRLVAEHLPHPGRERLGAVEDDQQPVLEPRATRSASSDLTTVLFSVEPSHSPTGILVPSAVLASATTTHRSAMCSPSSINTLTSSSVRSRAISSASAVWVCLTNRRDTADLEVDFAVFAACSPTGSPTRACRREATPASIRSNTICVSRSSAAKWP